MKSSGYIDEHVSASSTKVVMSPSATQKSIREMQHEAEPIKEAFYYVPIATIEYVVVLKNVEKELEEEHLRRLGLL